MTTEVKTVVEVRDVDDYNYKDIDVVIFTKLNSLGEESETFLNFKDELIPLDQVEKLLEQMKFVHKMNKD
ncbi:hypothetical protein vBVpaMR16F_245 [Vibrio phage vB_VpaM_R16F]|nr:hypothetical protein vBVpaMR16F_245 [Vibrio phage vB_VpaM_R16F]